MSTPVQIAALPLCVDVELEVWLCVAAGMIVAALVVEDVILSVADNLFEVVETWSALTLWVAPILWTTLVLLSRIVDVNVDGLTVT